MTKKYCDLHTHTLISDGIYSPDELVKIAVEDGLSVLCMTDHNAINYDLPALRMKYPQIELPYGCEFSCSYTIRSSGKNYNKTIQLHVGGIGFDPNNENVKRVIRHNQESMREYIEKTLYKLNHICGIDIGSYDELLSRNSESQTFGRKHVAAEMVKQGFCDNIDEAFDKYLGNRGGYERPAYVSNAFNFVSVKEAVDAITSAGGIASLCHLLDYVDRNQMDDQEVDELLFAFRQLAGNKGAMETYYSAYSMEEQNYLRELSIKHNLLESAASDLHGDGKIKKLGQYPYSVYEKMKMHCSKNGG